MGFFWEPAKLFKTNCEHGPTITYEQERSTGEDRKNHISNSRAKRRAPVYIHGGSKIIKQFSGTLALRDYVAAADEAASLLRGDRPDRL